jgi:hypothetical protein
MAELLINYARAVADVKRAAVVSVFAQSSPILERLHFIDIGDAMGYEYDRESVLPGVGFRSLNGSYPTQAEGMNVPVKEGTAIMGGLVKTDYQLAKNASRKASRVAKKAQAAGLLFTKKFFDGNTATTPTEFDGLNRRLGVGPQTILAGVNGAALDLDGFVEMCDLVIGDESRKAAFMSKAMRRLLGKAIRIQGSAYVTMADWASALTPTRFNNVQIVVIERDEADVEILGFDETVGGSGATTGSIYCVNFGQTVDEDLFQGIARLPGNAAPGAGGLFEVQEQGVRDTTDQALVEGRVGLVTFHGRSAARYYGIKNEVQLES